MHHKHEGTRRTPRALALAMAGALAASAALLLGGCAGAGAPPISTAEVAAGLESYHLGAGDRVRVTVFNEPSLTGEYNITPGGALAFPLIGVVSAGGRTYRANEKTVFLRRQTGKGESAVPLRQAQVAVLPGDTIRVGERYF